MMVGSPLTPDKYPKYIYNVSWDDNNPRSKRAIHLLDADHSRHAGEGEAIATDVHDILADMWKADAPRRPVETSAPST